MALFTGAVRAAYVLVKAAEVRPFDGLQVAEAAAACLDRLVELWEAEGHLVLQERNGWLVVNGVAMRPSVEGYLAVESVGQLLRRWGVGEVLLDRGTSVDDLETFAAVLGLADAAQPGIDVQTLLEGRGVERIRVERRSEAGPRPGFLPERRAAAPTSRIRAMFVANRFLGAMSDRRRVTHSSLVRWVVDLVDGDELLLTVVSHLERDRELLARSVGVGMEAAAVCERMRLPPKLSGEVVTAALCHGLGAVVDPLRPPAIAAFQYLLERGDCSDQVLRAALIVRRLHGDHAGADGHLGLWIVEAAQRLHRGDLPHRVGIEGLKRGWPDELADAVMAL